MVLPSLRPKPGTIDTPESRNSIILAQKVLHKGALFTMAHKGNSIVALSKEFSLRVVMTSDDFRTIELIRHGIGSVASTNIVYAPKAPKPIVKPKPVKEKKKRRKFTIDKEVEEI